MNAAGAGAALVAGLALTMVQLTGVSSAGAVPDRAPNSSVHELSCDGEVVAVLHTPGGSAPSWTVDDGRDVMNHARWIDLRVYEGESIEEPATDPVFADTQRFGNRWGQGEGTHCRLVEPLIIDGVRYTLYADAEIVTRER